MAARLVFWALAALDIVIFALGALAAPFFIDLFSGRIISGEYRPPWILALFAFQAAIPLTAAAALVAVIGLRRLSGTQRLVVVAAPILHFALAELISMSGILVRYVF